MKVEAAGFPYKWVLLRNNECSLHGLRLSYATIKEYIQRMKPAE